jgi:type VI secretion system protein ImpE
MSRAKAMFEAGELQAAIHELTGKVKASPTDTAQRISLFEMLLFTGDWERAGRQLEVIGQQSLEAGLGVQVYRDNLKAEIDRSRLFAEGQRPHFISPPPAHVERHLEAIDCLRQGKIAAAIEQLDRAEEERPAFKGNCDGQPFADFRDYNDLVGSVLELIVQGQYTWLPFEQIERLEIAAPKGLRDLIWAPARLECTDGTGGEVYIPALYEGSGRHANDQVRLGRMTDWQDIGEGLYLPSGLRLLLLDGEDRGLFDAGQLVFDPVETRLI